MIYSKIYKKYYPFKAQSDVFMLNKRERELLIKYIIGFPVRAVDVIRNAWKCGVETPNYPKPKDWFSTILPSRGVADILIELQQRSNELISKITGEEPLSDNDIEDINCILYSNKYGRLLSLFVFPTP